jgi:hypothetical protein
MDRARAGGRCFTTVSPPLTAHGRGRRFSFRPAGRSFVARWHRSRTAATPVSSTTADRTCASCPRRTSLPATESPRHESRPRPYDPRHRVSPPAAAPRLGAHCCGANTVQAASLPRAAARAGRGPGASSRAGPCGARARVVPRRRVRALLRVRNAIACFRAAIGSRRPRMRTLSCVAWRSFAARGVDANAELHRRTGRAARRLRARAHGGALARRVREPTRTSSACEVWQPHPGDEAGIPREHHEGCKAEQQ